MVDCPKKMLFHAARSDSEHLRHFFHGPFFDIAQGKHLLLANGEATKQTPDVFAVLTAHGLLFWGWLMT